MRTFIIGRGDWWATVQACTFPEFLEALREHGCKGQGLFAHRAWQHGFYHGKKDWNACEVLP